MAASGPRIEKIDSSRLTSMTWPRPPLTSTLRTAITVAMAPDSPAIMSAMASGGQHGLAILEAVARGEARHGLDEGAEAWTLRVRPGLAEPRHPHDDQLRIAHEQRVGADAELLQIAEPEALDHDVEVRGEIEDDAGRLRRFQVERDALLVPRVDLPVHAHAGLAPVAQRVAPAGRLDLHHLGAEVGELQAQHVAGHQPGEIEHADAAQRPLAVRLERLFRDRHRVSSGGAKSTRPGHAADAEKRG